MSDLRDLYQEVIQDHNRNPRNYRKLESANRRAEGYNPLCGDQVMLYLELEDGLIKDISFQGSGCAISKASASMMTTSLKGKTKAEAEALFEIFHQMIRGEGDPAEELSRLGRLAAFAGVSQFPVRVKCAILAWHALRSALEGTGEKKSPVSTE